MLGLSIVYNDNVGYRKCLRQFCDMSCVDIFAGDVDIDSISRDENLFDFKAMQITMDILYEKTCKSPAFKVLYDLAAARMFSEDREIGLCVLLSYDYFPYYYAIYSLFEKHGELIIETDCYIHLKNILS